MRVALRVDASLAIGTGHVMRCATLARTLRDRGADCHFICREHDGNLTGFLRSAGFHVSSLPVTDESDPDGPFHRSWLGATWRDDAERTSRIADHMSVDWLIVDHYALDTRWEEQMATGGRRLLVIDDLADRPHAADLLLDQTFEGGEERYRPLVPQKCLLLCGSKFALLRPEFAQMAELGRSRTGPDRIGRVLVTLGGVDRNNVTGLVLDAIDASTLPARTVIEVVMGRNAPWLDAIRARAQTARCDARVHVDVEDMASLMSQSDLAIGAAGSTAWERCCLGLPSLMAVIADNQAEIARRLHAAGAAWSIGDAAAPAFTQLLIEAIDTMVNDPDAGMLMSRAATAVTDGRGAQRVADMIWQLVRT